MMFAHDVRESSCVLCVGTGSKYTITRCFLAYRYSAWASAKLVGQCFVMLTLPTFLCSSESYWDFMLNATATYFVVQLDDLASEQEYQLIVKGSKSRSDADAVVELHAP
mmetsp:Transcript_34074/g.88866  ORF Transcript_34074/g.88866 Transcript_34074/m.88866 type:complete len:109 (+) Transcript_34074:2-328(+)